MDVERKGMDGLEPSGMTDGCARTSKQRRNSCIRVSLAEQQLAIEEYYRKHGYVIVEAYQEVGPGTSK